MWTDKQIKAIKPQEKSFRITEDTKKRGGGRLLLEIKPDKRKYFFFQYFRKQDNKSKRVLVTIGRFKDSAKTSGFSLSDARDKCLEFESLLKQGVDVKSHLIEKENEKQERIRKMEAERLQGSFAQLLDSYLNAMKADGKRSHANVRRALDCYVHNQFPSMVKKKANTVEVDDIQLILARMIDKGITTQANRVRSYLHTAFQYGLKQDNNPRRHSVEEVKFNLKYNPVSFVPKQADYERVGEHVISDGEIRIIWRELSDISPMADWAIKLCFTTGQRFGELVRLEWSHFDEAEKLLLIPASVSKNKRDHVIPLNKLSLSVLKDMKKLTGDYQYIFPASNRAGYIEDQHIDTGTISKVVRNYCVENKKVSKFLARDIRRTVKTLMGKAGVSKELRDRIQNHAMTDVSSKHYDRYDYLPEKRQAMKVWNNYLELIINPNKKVTHISKGVKKHD